MHFPSLIFRVLIIVIYPGYFCQAQQKDPNVYIHLSMPSDWTTANAHSHNDYQQLHPFTSAYDAGFGSMEADIFLFHDSLFVGHEEKDILKHQTIEALYLDSIAYYLRKNKGSPFQQSTKNLQLLIDIKTEPISTLNALMQVLKKYPETLQAGALHLVITGNRPAISLWQQYPHYLFFDGNIGEDYPAELKPRIALMSGNMANYTSWKGNEQMNASDIELLIKIITNVHGQGKKIRFWNAPDSPQAWSQLILLGADWINTDHIPELAAFLKNPQ